MSHNLHINNGKASKFNVGIASHPAKINSLLKNLLSAADFQTISAYG
ncbi:MAG: hypothetical protein HZB59_03820 [Ignavibacteriales bacterium]|nr:hypothetical protein [Ignavibacteriales bacterium]